MDDSLPSRRRVLSAGLAAATTAIAGCLGSLGVDGSDPERSLVLTLSYDEGSLRETYVVDLAETRPEWDEAAFAALLDGETNTSQYRRPFYSTPEDPKYAVRDGTYYRLGSVVVDEAAERRPVLRLREGEGDEDSDAVPADDLPEGDRRAVQIAHMAARARDDQGGVPWGLVQRGGYVYRREEAVEASRLLSAEGPDRVVFRETTYAVDVTRERFYEPVYRATAEPVTDSPEQIEAILRAKFLDARFTREDLSSEAQRSSSRPAATATPRAIPIRRPTGRSFGHSTRTRTSTAMSRTTRCRTSTPAGWSATTASTTTTGFGSGTEPAEGLRLREGQCRSDDRSSDRTPADRTSSICAIWPSVATSTCR
jgi:hypothetical protein